MDHLAGYSVHYVQYFIDPKDNPARSLLDHFIDEAY